MDFNRKLILLNLGHLFKYSFAKIFFLQWKIKMLSSSHFPGLAYIALQLAGFKGIFVLYFLNRVQTKPL